MEDTNRICAIEGCDQPTGVRGSARGWCRKHYGRWYRHGDPTVILTAPTGALLEFIETIFNGNASREPSGCILWPFGRPSNGYPLIKWKGVKQSVGHLVLEHFVGARPSEKHVMGHAPHSVCGNRHCLAPEHLSWMTHSENLLQAAHVDRTISGENHHAANVSDDAVREAIKRVRSGEKHKDVAKDLGVNRATVSGWVSGKRRVGK